MAACERGGRGKVAVHVPLEVGDVVVAQQGIEAQQNFVSETLGQMGAADLQEFERLLLLSRDLVRAAEGEQDAPAAKARKA